MVDRRKTREARTRGADIDERGKKKSTRIARTRGSLENLKNGRPTDYTPELCETVRIMARGGATMFEIASALNVTVQTLHNWAAREPSFFEALYKDGKEAWDDRIERTLADRALGYTYESEKVFSNGTRMKVLEHVPPDVGAAKMWLGARRSMQWADRQTIDLNADVRTESNSDRELALAVLALLQSAAQQPRTIDHDNE